RGLRGRRPGHDRRVDQHGLRSRERSTQESLRGLVRRRENDGARQSECALYALPAGPPWGGGQRGSDRRAAKRRMGRSRKPSARAKGAVGISAVGQTESLSEPLLSISVKRQRALDKRPASTSALRTERRLSVAKRTWLHGRIPKARALDVLVSK